MAKASRPDHFVVDGSNIATEGRSQPSLDQLNEAVLAFMDDHPGAVITVVVDATFGHRIDGKEVKAFDEAVANNELVTPPAGAIGRGDAFVLTIANKAGAGVLSNDSFQEFHGEYDWLFDEGRLIGGKPVPHVGWVFVARTPVRGPKSRQSVREAKDDAKGADPTGAKQRANSRVRKKAAASETAVPSSTDAGSEADAPSTPSESGGRSGRSRGGRGRGAKQAEAAAAVATEIDAAQPPAPSSRKPVNELMPFLEFVQRHPVGTSCTGVVESYASHGAYARVDDVLIYIPLRLMDDPAPRSARSVLAAGEAVTAVIVGYVPDRRSIDAALPHMATALPLDEADVAAVTPATPARTGTGRAAQKTPAKKAGADRVAPASAPSDQDAVMKQSTRMAPASKRPARKAATAGAEKAPAKQPTAKKAPVKQAAAKKAPAKKAAAKKAPAKQAAAKKAPAKQAPAKKPVARKAAVKKPAAKKAATKKAPAKKATG